MQSLVETCHQFDVVCTTKIEAQMKKSCIKINRTNISTKKKNKQKGTICNHNEWANSMKKKQ